MATTDMVLMHVPEELLRDERTTRVNDPEFSQPLCTALQIGIADLYASLDVRPSVVVGHSSGEIAAAFVSLNIKSASAVDCIPDIAPDYFRKHQH